MKSLKLVVLALFVVTVLLVQSSIIFASDGSFASETVIVQSEFALPSSDNSLTNFGLSVNNPLARGTSIPTTAYSWSAGDPTFSANSTLVSGGYLYTNCYFTSFTNGTITVYNNNDLATDKLRIYICRINPGGIDENMYHDDINPLSGKIYTLSNYDPSQKYYLEFLCVTTGTSQRLMFNGSIHRTN